MSETVDTPYRFTRHNEVIVSFIKMADKVDLNHEIFRHTSRFRRDGGRFPDRHFDD